MKSPQVTGEEKKVNRYNLENAAVLILKHVSES
jgi:hypothetical protein